MNTLSNKAIAIIVLIGANLMSEARSQPTTSKLNNSNNLKVTITNIAIDKPGNILVMLYGDVGFPKEHAKAVSIEVIPAKTNELTVSFKSVPDEFAIKVLHDEDESGQVTKNWTGIMPAEGLGFSNGAKLRFGPPTFEKAKVKLSDINQDMTIKIIYP